MVLASYNIHGFIGRDKRFDPDRILQVLDELQADIVALQEFETVRDGGLDLLDYLCDKTGLTGIAGPTLLREISRFGNAILCRQEVVDYRRIDLSIPKREPRGALEIEVKYKGMILQVVATHLGLKPAERRLQIGSILDLFRSDPKQPAVLLGDLNEWFLWGRPLRWLHAYFQETPALATFPAGFPLFALDRIWVRPRDALVSIEVHNTQLARIASDHLPIKAVVEW